MSSLNARLWWSLCVLLLVLSCFLVYADNVLDPDDFPDDRPSRPRRCLTIRNSLKNGRVKLRSRGRIAKFVCNTGFELVGKRYATCIRGEWNYPVPICVAQGCRSLRPPKNGKLVPMYRGALIIFSCGPGYVLEGSPALYCDGRAWNGTSPSCEVAIKTPSLSCDFESEDLCGWTQDPGHDFDWKRQQFSTPSGHVGTGPTHDHTFGKGNAGHYMFIEASSPRKENDTARLFSPVYPQNYTNRCFVFWYHMYGATTGFLRVFVKGESQVLSELHPSWQKQGEQGNQWLRGAFPLPPLYENFQIVIEGVRGSSYVGDTAIDDVSLQESDCWSSNYTVTDYPFSCFSRCGSGLQALDFNFTCSCDPECEDNGTCCEDYYQICIPRKENNTDEEIREPQEPGYGSSTILPETYSSTLKSTVIISTSSARPPTTTSSTVSSTTKLSTSSISITTPRRPISTSSSPSLLTSSLRSIPSSTWTSTPTTKQTSRPVTQSTSTPSRTSSTLTSFQKTTITTSSSSKRMQTTPSLPTTKGTSGTSVPPTKSLTKITSALPITTSPNIKLSTASKSKQPGGGFTETTFGSSKGNPITTPLLANTTAISSPVSKYSTRVATTIIPPSIRPNASTRVSIIKTTTKFASSSTMSPKQTIRFQDVTVSSKNWSTTSRRITVTPPSKQTTSRSSLFSSTPKMKTTTTTRLPLKTTSIPTTAKTIASTTKPATTITRFYPTSSTPRTASSKEITPPSKMYSRVTKPSSPRITSPTSELWKTSSSQMTVSSIESTVITSTESSTAIGKESATPPASSSPNGTSTIGIIDNEIPRVPPSLNASDESNDLSNEIPNKPSSSASRSGGGGSSSEVSKNAIIGVVACVAVLTVAAIAFFVARIRRRKQNKLAEDSEMRFLSDNEVVEFIDACQPKEIPRPKSKLLAEEETPETND